jgi:hypothetical protein
VTLGELHAKKLGVKSRLPRGLCVPHSRPRAGGFGLRCAAAQGVGGYLVSARRTPPDQKDGRSYDHTGDRRSLSRVPNAPVPAEGPADVRQRD